MKLDLKTMIIAGAVVMAMTVEAVVFVMLMPRSSKPTAGAAADGTGDAAATPEAPTSDYAEEPIGEFKCTNNQEESMLHLRFKVDAVVKSSERVPFRDANNARKARVREVIEKIVRSASRDDLDDPNLSTLKRLIKVEVNKVLEKSFVTEAVIHDFSMIEQ
jgi:flagellar basal body-associated protein FliL